MAVYATAGIVRRTYPWGPAARNTNDLGQQFIPMYAHYRDILTGSAHGDLIFNWNSGYGVPFLDDFMSYVGSTLSWLVILLPRDRIDLALYLVFLVAIGLSAAGMAAYLHVIRPTGRLWLSALAGVSYGVSAWPVEAGYMTVWLNGVVAFPILCLIGELVLTRTSVRVMALSPLVVMLLWSSHFYTVYMATLGAALVILARALTMDGSWRTGVLGLLRVGIVTALGIGLTAPLLIPTFKILKAATPSPGLTFEPAPTLVFLARLLTGTAGVAATPALAVGTLMLVLAVTLAFNRRLQVRHRLVWVAMLGLTLVSMQVPVTHEIWHGFDTPNGNPYRQAFVVGGMIVILGWLSATAGLTVRLAGAALVLVLGLFIAVRHAYDVTDTTRWLLPLSLAALALIGLGLRYAESRRRTVAHVLAVGLLFGAVFGEQVMSAVAVEDSRSQVLHALPAWGSTETGARRLVQSADDWPRSRTSAGDLATVNDPMLIGGEGGQYYSSAIPQTLSATLIRLGWGYSSYGRALVDPGLPLTDALFGVTHRVVSGDGTARPESLHLIENRAAPLFTIRTGPSISTGNPAPFGALETALGAPLFDVPTVTVHPGTGIKLSLHGRRRDVVATRIGSGAGKANFSLTATCAPGSTLYLYAPAFVGQYQVNGEWVTALSEIAARPGVYTGLPLRQVGSVPRTGQVQVEFRVSSVGRLPARSLGCLRPGALAAALARLQGGAPMRVSVSGHGFRAAVSGGTRGTLVAATTRIPGWQCSTNGRPAHAPAAVAGLVAVPLDGTTTSVTCSYRPPGVRLGLLASGLSLLGYAVFLRWFLRDRPTEWVLRRRRPASGGEAASLT